MEWQFTNQSAAQPKASKSDYLLTSIRVRREHGYDYVTFWNRGACAGMLTMQEGDGLTLANNITSRRSVDLKEHWTMERTK